MVSGNVLPGGELGLMGRTVGRGKDAKSKRPNRSIKEVLGYPLHKRFRELLSEVGG